MFFFIGICKTSIFYLVKRFILANKCTKEYMIVAIFIANAIIFKGRSID